MPQVQQGDCGLVRSFEVQRQSVAQTPVFYRLEKMRNEEAYIGYVQLKEFNSLAKKDLVTGMQTYLKFFYIYYLIINIKIYFGCIVSF